MDDAALRDQDTGRADPRLEMVFEQRVEIGVHVFGPHACGFAAALPPEGE